MNSASRLVSVFNAAVKSDANPGVKCMQAWGWTLECTTTAGTYDEDSVTTALMALRGEIDLARAKLGAAGCPPELFDRYLTHFRSTTAPALLQSEWRSHKPTLKNDILVALQWAAFTLPNEEDEVPSDELSDLAQQIETLAEAIAASSISPYVRDFIGRQLQLVRVALRQYKVCGIAPVEKALHETYGVLATNGSILNGEFERAGPKEKHLFTRFNEVLATVATTADRVDKVRSGAESLASLYHHAAQVWAWAQHLLK